MNLNLLAVATIQKLPYASYILDPVYSQKMQLHRLIATPRLQEQQHLVSSGRESSVRRLPK